MDDNMPEQFDTSVKNESRLAMGNIVGDLAMGYFGQFIEIPFSKDKTAMINETKRLINAETKIIAEASFAYEDNFCSVDILRLVDGGYELVEVKSSTGSDTDEVDKIKSIYLHDMAYQVFVLTKCGVNIKKVSIMQLNRDYVRHGELDIQRLFVLTDCTDQVFNMQNDILNNIADIKKYAEKQEEPMITIGSRCDAPYECGYKKWCFRNLPENNVYDIGWGMWGSKKDAAYNAGFITFKDILSGGVKLSEKQHRQVIASVNELPPQIDRSAISAFLSEIKYPLYHLDFETYQQAVPLWDSVSPYMQIPFQYSIHIQKEPYGNAIHKEFLGKEGIDPRHTLAERLCADIPMGACVLAYNMSFEKGIIKELARLFPQLSEHLLNINENMIDLATPFQSGAYYCRAMGGSYSIKSVLPAMCPNDPELDYKTLTFIQNGEDAMNAYASLHEKAPKEVQEIRAALLAYCRLDTLAMVKVLEKLYGMI